jgi:hypothetical protein
LVDEKMKQQPQGVSISKYIPIERWHVGGWTEQ